MSMRNKNVIAFLNRSWFFAMAKENKPKGIITKFILHLKWTYFFSQTFNKQHILTLFRSSFDNKITKENGPKRILPNEHL